MYHVAVQGAPMQRLFLETVGIADERAAQIPRYVRELEAIAPNTNVDAVPRAAWRLVVRPALEAADLSWRALADGLGVAYNGTAIQKTGIGRERLATIGTLLKSKDLVSLATSDVLWDEVVSIEAQGVEDVYDATVPGAHNFVANDIIVHNSIEQDADVVMFIHRDDKMNETSDRPNIAEILVEKHRNGPVGKIDLYFDEKKTSFLSIEKSNFAALGQGAGVGGGQDEGW
jgi:replicative DNA helicase